MKIRILALLFCMLLWQQSFSAIYTPMDSLKVVRLLAAGAKQASNENLIMYYAKQFINTPYVPATLEINETEELVVNLRQLDCTTFVEVVVALAFTTWSGTSEWCDFLHWLQTIRYQKGVREGYVSRNHYFSQWILSNAALGLVCEREGEVFTGKQILCLDYMSSHPEKYAKLKHDSLAVKVIREKEQELFGKEVHYISKHSLNALQEEMEYIKNGDILAIVTNKKGLDVSHVGFAVWDNRNQLHLLHASSIHKKVVLDSLTMFAYLNKHSSRLGLRVIRPQYKEQKHR